MERYAMVCYGTVMVWYGMVWYGCTVWYSIVDLIYSVATVAWYSMTRKGDVRYGEVYMVWCTW